jgi:hypothetical protein
MAELLRLILMGAGGGIVIALALVTFSPKQGQSNLGLAVQQPLVLQAFCASTGTLFGIVGYAFVKRRRRTQPWTEWRPFQVSSKTYECEGITSFALSPLDRMPLQPFLPGQFLTLELNIPGQKKSVLRTYSISDFPTSGDLITHKPPQP